MEHTTTYATTQFLTKFECARLLGMRVLQLSEQRSTQESKQFLEEIAIEELLNGTNPTVVRRYLANGTYEDRKVSDLKIDKHMREYQLNPRRLQLDTRAKHLDERINSP